MDVSELRSAVSTAVEGMEKSLRNLQEPQEGADVEVLEADFTDKQDTHARAVKALDRATAVEEARSSLPVPPAEPVVEERQPAESALRTGKEPLTYDEREADGSVSRRSIFRDMLSSKSGDGEARERLERHQAEMKIEARTAINQTAGEGGEIIPPVYLQSKWVALPRASRPVADSLNKQPWISGTNSINLPKIGTGTAVAVQTDGGAVKETKVATEEVTAKVQTVAGQELISQQLLDMSVPGIDTIIYDDLSRAYATELDKLVLTGTVTNAKGFNELSGTNAITYTESTPKVGKFYSKIASAIAEVETNTYMVPSVIAMSPKRWAWLLASTDSNERPLIVPVGQPGFNAAGLQGRVAAESYVGNMFGIPVLIDASIPSTKGASTNQDEVFVYVADQCLLWESTPTLRLLEQTKAGNLEVLAQIFGYYALMLGRLPKAISKIEGTGLAAPSF
jgi:HK97 family phage major capsid protein